MDKNNKITEIKGYTKYLDLSHRYYILTPLTKQALSDLSDANFINSENGNYKDVPEYCKSSNLEEIAKQNYNLAPSKYIEFIDFDKLF